MNLTYDTAAIERKASRQLLEYTCDMGEGFQICSSSIKVLTTLDLWPFAIAMPVPIATVNTGGILADRLLPLLTPSGHF